MSFSFPVFFFHSFAFSTLIIITTKLERYEIHPQQIQMLLTDRIVFHEFKLGFESVSCHHVIIPCTSHANKPYNDASSGKIIKSQNKIVSEKKRKFLMAQPG